MDVCYLTWETPIGSLTAIQEGEGLGALCQTHRMDLSGLEERETPLLEAVQQQMMEYFSGKRKVFDLPLSLKGTPFQKEVWNALRQIPFGETRSYKELAQMVGNPKACRAVGMANHNNPIMIVVPCHRVVGSDGKLTGYAGGLPLKAALLELERKYR